MTIIYSTKKRLWETADNLLTDIAKEDNPIDILRGIIVEPKQINSIARRVLWAVYPDSKRDTAEYSDAYELARVYTTCAVALQYYGVAFMKAFIATGTDDNC